MKKQKVKEIVWADDARLTPEEKEVVRRNWEELFKYLFDEEKKKKVKKS